MCTSVPVQKAQKEGVHLQFQYYFYYVWISSVKRENRNYTLKKDFQHLYFARKLFFNFYIFVKLIWKAETRETNKSNQTELPSADSLPSSLQGPELSCGQNSNQVFHMVVETNYLSHHWCLQWCALAGSWSHE